MTTTRNQPGLTNHTAIAGPGMAARIRAAGERLSDRIHAAAGDRARAQGWEVTETPGRLGLTGRSYHDPRFAARRPTLQETSVRKG